MTALSERAHFVVGAIARDGVAAGVLGSFADGGEDELRRFVREWAKGRPGVEADVVLDSESVTVLPFPLPENVDDAR